MNHCIVKDGKSHPRQLHACELDKLFGVQPEISNLISKEPGESLKDREYRRRSILAGMLDGKL